jgi:hypothetical protein
MNEMNETYVNPRCEDCANHRELKVSHDLDSVHGPSVSTCTFTDEDTGKTLGLPAAVVFNDEEGCNGGDWFVPRIIVAN